MCKLRKDKKICYKSHNLNKKYGFKEDQLDVYIVYFLWFVIWLILFGATKKQKTDKKVRNKNLSFVNYKRFFVCFFDDFLPNQQKKNMTKSHRGKKRADFEGLPKKWK